MLFSPGFLSWGIEFKIRQADVADCQVIAQFNLRLAQETEALALDPARVEQGVAALLKDSAKGCYYLAEVDGTVVGQVMITYEWSDWRNGNIWWLQSVYVRPDFRRQGVFRALFHHLLQLARAQTEVCCLRLYMHGDNSRARHSYEQLGMRRTRYEVFEMELSRKTAIICP